MALAFLTSCLLIAALPPYDLWPLAWVGLVPLLLALPGTTPREAAVIGCFSGTATNFMAFYWVMELMAKFSKLGPAGYLVMLAMALYQSIPWALWCHLLRRTGPAGPQGWKFAGGLLLSASSGRKLSALAGSRRPAGSPVPVRLPSGQPGRGGRGHGLRTQACPGSRSAQ